MGDTTGLALVSRTPFSRRLYLRRLRLEKALDRRAEELGVHHIVRQAEKRLAKEDEDGTSPVTWCETCDDDARWCCLDCANELFCDRCWSEVHQGDEELEKHRRKVFEATQQESDEED